MRRLATLPCLLALAAGVAACGGDDPKPSSAPAEKPATAATVPTAPTTPSAGAGTVALGNVKSCLASSGLKTEAQPDEADGLDGKGLKVPLGEADFDDPSKPGTFGFFGYVYVFDTVENAQKFDGLASGSRFQSGEVRGNAYIGFNSDLPKLEETPNGAKFLSCVSS